MPVRLKTALGAPAAVFWRGLLSPIADYVAAGLATLAALGILALALAGPLPPYGTWGAWLAAPAAAPGGRITLALLVGLGALRFCAAWLPAWCMPPPRRPQAQPCALAAPARAEAWRALSRVLASQGLFLGRARPLDDGSQTALARPLGAARLCALADLGLALLALAGVVQSLLGWTGAPASLLVGESAALAPEAGLVVHLAAVETRPRADGAPRLVRAHWRVGTREIVLGRGGRAQVGRWTLALVGTSPALRLEARTAAGQALELVPLVGAAVRGPLVRLRWAGGEQEQHVALPDANLVLRVVRVAAPGPDRFRVEALSGRDGRPLAQVETSSATTLSVQHVEIALTPEFALAVRAERALGLPLALLAGALCALGAGSALVARPRYAWALLTPNDAGWRGTLLTK